MDKIIQWCFLPLVFVIFIAKITRDDLISKTPSWDGFEKRRVVLDRNTKRKAPRQEAFEIAKSISLLNLCNELGINVQNPRDKKLFNSFILRENQRVIVEKRREKVMKVVGNLLDGSRIELTLSEDKIWVEKSKPYIIAKTRDVSGLVFDDFASSLQEASINYNVISQVVKLLGRTPQPGANYSLRILEEFYEDGSVKSQILFGFYVNQGGKEFFKARLSERGSFHDLTDIDAKTSSWLIKPVNGRVTSPFSHSRLHPILGFRRMHPAIDISAPYGTPVKSVSDGTVTFAGWYGGSGNMVKIYHGNGIETVYRHLSKIKVKPNQRVKAGEIIGNVGSTGLSTGPHLCFSVIVSGKPYDPLKFKPPLRPKLSEKDSKKLRELFNQLKTSSNQIKFAQQRLANAG